MHIVYVHDAKIVKENGLTLQFCSNYPPKMSRIDAMYIFLTNYNTFRRSFSPNRIDTTIYYSQAIPHRKYTKQRKRNEPKTASKKMEYREDTERTGKSIVYHSYTVPTQNLLKKELPEDSENSFYRREEKGTIRVQLIVPTKYSESYPL